MGIKKVKTIVKSYLEELPINEDWYKKRLEICDTCPLNSKNISKESLSITDRALIKSGICDNGNHCTACKCCIERKASVKIEECGLAKIGQKPKWNAIEVESNIDRDISVINLSPESGNFTIGKSNFDYDFGKVNSPKVSMKFQVKRKTKIEVKSFNNPCKCTVGELKQVDDNTVEFNVDISTVDFKKGINSRSLIITYYTNNLKNNTKNVNIIFKIDKQ